MGPLKKPHRGPSERPHRGPSNRPYRDPTNRGPSDKNTQTKTQAAVEARASWSAVHHTADGKKIQSCCYYEKCHIVDKLQCESG